MGMFSGNPKEEPMHYGEVFGLWTFLAAAKGGLVQHQTLLNHTGDEDLRNFIEDIIKHGDRPIIEELEKLLKENGVGLPPTPPERPHANHESIPVGARFNDPEIATALAAGISSGLIACSTIMGESIREDIGTMFGQFHMKKAQFGVTLLRLQKEKGWIVPPPLHIHD